MRVLKPETLTEGAVAVLMAALACIDASNLRTAFYVLVCVYEIGSNHGISTAQLGWHPFTWQESQTLMCSFAREANDAIIHEILESTHKLWFNLLVMMIITYN